jgi:hypothetical protein
VIPGPKEEWDAFAEVPVSGQCTADAGDCGPLPASLRIAIAHGDAGADAFAFRMALAGGVAPVKTDPTRRYVVEMSALPSHEIPVVDSVNANSVGLVYERSRVSIPLTVEGAPDVPAAWTPDGFEVSVPFSLLPFQEGMQIRAYIERADGDDWVPISTVDAPILACWDPTDLRGDPCR